MNLHLPRLTYEPGLVNKKGAGSQQNAPFKTFGKAARKLKEEEALVHSSPSSDQAGAAGAATSAGGGSGSLETAFGPTVTFPLTQV